MRHLLFAALMFPLAAVAVPTSVSSPAPSTTAQAGAESLGGWDRAQRAVGLAQALDLNQTDAVRVDATIRQFDAQRRPLHQQMKQGKALLRRAAAGDASALGQVDAAIQNVTQAKTQMAAVNQQMMAALSQGLTPQQRAKMALYFTHGGGHRGQGRFGKHAAN